MFDTLLKYVDQHFIEIIIVIVLIFFIAKINKNYNIEKFISVCDLTIQNNMCSSLILTVGDKRIGVQDGKLVESSNDKFTIMYNNNGNNIFILNKGKYLTYKDNQLVMMELDPNLEQEFMFDIIAENKIKIYRKDTEQYVNYNGSITNQKDANIFVLNK